MDINQYANMAPWDWPENMGDLLLPLLKDAAASTEDRLVAVSMAGDPCVIDDTLAGALVAIVKDNGADENLRGRAAIALGPALEGTDLALGFEDDEDDLVALSEAVFDAIKGDLEACYRDSDAPKEVRRRCLEASVRAPQPWHPEAIRSAYRASDPEWRLTAVFGMNYIEGFEKEILESLQSDDPDIRYEAVSAAGSWEVAGAWPHIAALLTAGNTETDLLLAAIEASVNIRPSKVAEVVGPLTRHDDPEIVDAAQEAVRTAEVMLALDDED